MRKLIIPVFLLSFMLSTTALGQLRQNLSSPYDYSGPIINRNVPTVQNGLNRFFSSVEMSHSYSMNFSSNGRGYQNVNAYTNTLTFDISPRMNGRVSFLHSPFGANLAQGQNSFQNQVVIENAELNYKISDNAFIKFQYRQLPAGYGYNPFGYSRFGRYNNRYDNYGYWY